MLDTSIREFMHVDTAIADVELCQLQALFSELFDRAALSLQLKGFEQDDAVFDRYLLCEVNGQRVDVSAPWLASRERFLAHSMREVTLQTGRAIAPQQIRITGLTIIVRRTAAPRGEPRT